MRDPIVRGAPSISYDIVDGDRIARSNRSISYHIDSGIERGPR